MAEPETNFWCAISPSNEQHSETEPVLPIHPIQSIPPTIPYVSHCRRWLYSVFCWRCASQKGTRNFACRNQQDEAEIPWKHGRARRTQSHTTHSNIFMFMRVLPIMLSRCAIFGTCNKYRKSSR